MKKQTVILATTLLYRSEIIFNSKKIVLFLSPLTHVFARPNTRKTNWINLFFAMVLFTVNTFAKIPRDLAPDFKRQSSGTSFTENKGQVHDQFNKARPDVLFGGSDGALVFHLRDNGVSYQLKRVDRWKINRKERNNQTLNPGVIRKTPEQTTIYRLDINWLNANRAAIVSPGKALAGYANYYLENCAGGVKGVKTYEDVTYHNIYPGIDLKWYLQDGHLKYDYIVAQGADYKNIRLEIKGAEALKLDANGQLTIKTPLGEISEQAPVVMQGVRILPSKWIIEEGSNDSTSVLSFEIENINPAEAFTIDPLVRVWGTYYGGTGDETAGGAADPTSTASYIYGYTDSATGTVIATSGSCQDTYYGGYDDTFLAKFDASGQRLWATYYGGAGDDYGGNCAVDNSGNVVICGSTDSGTSIMATAGSHQPTYAGNRDLFLAKFNSNGGLLWSTYYGGSGTEYGRNCSVDKIGNIFLCGDAGSTNNIATSGAHQSSKGTANFAAFLVKFNSAGVRQWGTYYGGNSGADAYNCSTDGQGNVYLTGRGGAVTTSTDVATPGTFQQLTTGVGFDAFLVKFNTSGVRQWGTFFGGPDDDYPRACLVDSVGNVFLPGFTKSTSGISTPGAYQTTYGGGTYDAFLAKFNATGQRLWATYYGSPGTDDLWNGCFDKYENILLCGTTDWGTGTLIATPGSYQPAYGGGGSDLFIVKLTPAGNRVWGTYYGGNGDERGGVAGFDMAGNFFLAGITGGTNGIATPGTHQPTNGGGMYDAFLVKFNYCSPPVPVANTPSVNLIVCEGEVATLVASASGTLNWFAGVTGGTSLGTGTTFVTPVLTTGSYTYYVEAETCSPGEVRTAITLTVNACTAITQQYLIQNQTSIYPNPFSQKISVTRSSEETVLLKVYNASGALIHESAMKKETEIDLGNLSPGIYFMQIGSTTKKIVRE